MKITEYRRQNTHSYESILRVLEENYFSSIKCGLDKVNHDKCLNNKFTSVSILKKHP